MPNIYVPTIAMIVVQSTIINEDGTSYRYEARVGPDESDIRWVSDDIDDVLSFIRGAITGEEPIK